MNSAGKLSLLTAGLLMTIGLTSEAQELHFSAQDIAQWPTRSFKGETDYRLVKRDGMTVLQARARGQASAKYLEREIDLDETPYLHWCWQVSNTHTGLEETTKSGDDYPARVYVVYKTGLLPWQVQSVNYVWSSSQAAGTDWPNAFTSRAHLLALQGGEENIGRWMAEVRNVRDDFQILFDSRPNRIDGVALMSDGDNAGVDATAWFTQLGFSATPEPPDCPA
ncbi:hypothetical protein GCM10007160_11830 [Litchfieldella qijiaojingensis]|uniref:DUF3047 domain-containing protein n=1 Tax=Litchfieldella qijiaojingensis TaxID=980347 RepID=A0ABQ2YLR7_9GAMM|nr:DUF3047 domain-containing protein [Halomonas qijiaojingensis]GGX86202.1 hypothetical protein GCM10007160_11830 [Halomonas qijiaojingensis]